MSRSTKHGEIQERLRKEYKEKGYEVETEASVRDEKNNGFWVVDLIAMKEGKRIAIEIGVTQKGKLDALKELFDEVIHLPYLEITLEGLYIHRLCGYKWMPRVENPKECPRCKGRIDM